MRIELYDQPVALHGRWMNSLVRCLGLAILLGGWVSVASAQNHRTVILTSDASPGTASGVDFSGLFPTENFYLGIKNDLLFTGFSMDGGGISGDEIFRFDSVTASTIIYTGETLMQFSDP